MQYPGGEYSEVTQLMTRCTILESQIEVLEKQNAELKELVTKLYPEMISSTDENIRSDQWNRHDRDQWKDVPKVGKFPVIPDKDDGSFQV